MPAVLHTLRDLDAARARGELTEDEYRLRRDAAMHVIEDAEVAGEAPPDKPAPPAPPRAPLSPEADAWAKLAAIIIGFVALTLVATVVLRDVTLALTLSVSLLAAVVVKAFKGLGM